MPSPAHLARLLGGLGALALLATACTDQTPPLDPASASPLTSAGGPNIVHVAPPLGIVAEDRASIVAALEAVRPGGTVQFAPGTYVIGKTDITFEFIQVPVPRVTLRGHPGGTTLRGCDPAAIVPGNCNGLRLSGGFQTVRHLGFENFSQILRLGALPGQPGTTVGGYRIEDNTFHNSAWGIRSFGQWMQPAFVRNNAFVNLFRPVEVYGRTVHVMDNDISAPNPEQIPFFSVAWDAISFSTWDVAQAGPCDHNLAAGNRVEGHSMGVFIWVASTDGCRHNVIRDNTFVDSRELVAYDIPAGAVWLENEFEAPELLSHTLVQGNRILGAEGAGIFVYRTVRNRIVNNTVTDIVPAQSTPVWFGEGNGSGVWISPESRDNRLLNNRFAAVPAEEVILEGDHNQVATTSASDVVRDLGLGNRITGPGSVVTTAAPAGVRARAAADASADGLAAEGIGRARGRLTEP
jgi:hypothetical protein